MRVKMKKCRAKECDNLFTPSFSTLQKYCSSKCTYEAHKKKTDHEKRFYNIKPISKKRSKENKIYLAKRIVFLIKPENKYCPVFPSQKTTEVHHKKGRIGTLYLDETFWLAVSSDGHKWIENNPIEAKKRGFSLNRL